MMVTRLAQDAETVFAHALITDVALEHAAAMANDTDFTMLTAPAHDADTILAVSSEIVTAEEHAAEMVTRNAR